MRHNANWGNSSTTISVSACRIRNGHREPKISCSVMFGGATLFNTKAAGANGGDKNAICMFMQKRMPNQTGSKPRPVMIGRNTGMVRNRMPIQSMNVPSTMNMIIITPMTARGGMWKDRIRSRKKLRPPVKL